MMGGEVMVTSEPGKGSVFTVRLPGRRIIIIKLNTAAVSPLGRSNGIGYLRVRFLETKRYETFPPTISASGRGLTCSHPYRTSRPASCARWL